MDEEMMEAMNNQAHQMHREGLKDPSTETKDIDQYNGLFVDNEHADEETLAMVKLINAINKMYREAVRDPATETKDRVEDLGKKRRREILRNATAKNTDDVDQYRRRYISDET